MNEPTFGSLFSGIGGIDLGLERAGWRCAWQCEQDDACRRVLECHWPHVACSADVRIVGRHGHEAVDLLCGGFPCQDLSVAGQRRGLDGDRSGLFFEFSRIAAALRPRWLLVENVPGMLTSNGGRDFGAVLGTLADVGYGVAWRILDSRYFGVPQRRRRVFIVGSLADNDPGAAAERAGEILAVGSRCGGHSATGAGAGAEAAVVSLSGLGNGGPDDNDGQAGRLVTSLQTSGPPGTRRDDGAALITHALTSAGHDASEDGTGRGTPLVVADTLRSHPRPGSNSHGAPTAFHATGGGAKSLAAGSLSPGAGLGNNGAPAISSHAGVRRLTPTECERLQGFPDGWTIPAGADSRRYAALGNAVTVPVAEWIGRRLMGTLERAA